MGTRLQLQTLLETMLGSRNVYFQPPEGFKLSYPCIVYSLASTLPIYANNKSYIVSIKYQLILIHRDPDNSIMRNIQELQTCSFERHYISNNLHHYVYNLFY